MNQFGTAREALLVEAIGDFGKLLDRAEDLRSALIQSSHVLAEGQAQLADRLAAFDTHVVALADKAKAHVVKHIVARADDAADRSVDRQTHAMADAARVAFGAELGATMQRLQTTLEPLLKRRVLLWEGFLTHSAATAVGGAAAWTLALYAGLRC